MEVLFHLTVTVLQNRLEIPVMTEVQDIPEMIDEKNLQLLLALIVVLNVKYHLFQVITDQSIAVIVSDNTNHKILETIDIPEMTEVQEIPEMTEVQEIPEMTEVLVQVEVILDLKNKKLINF